MSRSPGSQDSVHRMKRRAKEPDSMPSQWRKRLSNSETCDPKNDDNRDRYRERRVVATALKKVREVTLQDSRDLVSLCSTTRRRISSLSLKWAVSEKTESPSGCN